VADIGCGVMASLLANGESAPLASRYSSEELSLLQRSFDKHLDHDYGLWSVRRNVLALSGYVELRSGSSCIAYSPSHYSETSTDDEQEIIAVSELATFPGTMVRILIPTPTYRLGKFDTRRMPADAL
jgi:hypothetical protein